MLITRGYQPFSQLTENWMKNGKDDGKEFKTELLLCCQNMHQAPFESKLLRDCWISCWMGVVLICGGM